MYESFFGLTERPFELTPNPRYLCLTPQHREALSTLKYGVTTARGITLLIGEAGTGKTTLIQSALLSEKRNDSLCVCLSNPTFSRSEFVHFLADEFKLSSEAATSKPVMLRELSQLLHTRHERGALTMLVIDEAQSLPYDLLEEVRLLANLETPDEKLLPVVLAGQPELADRLNEPALRQLKQRVALRCTLTPLDLQQTCAYVAGRLKVAGGFAQLAFTREAVQRVHEYSGGLPRVISVICDNSLLAGFARGERPVTSKLVAEVCADFDLNGTGGGMKYTASAAAPPVVAPAIEPSHPKAQAVTQPDTHGRSLFETVMRARHF